MSDITQSKPPQCSFLPLLHILTWVTREQRPAPPFELPLLRELQGAMRLPLGLLFSGLDSPSVLSISLQDVCQPFYQIYCPPLDAFKDINILFTLWSSELHTAFKVRLHQC